MATLDNTNNYLSSLMSIGADSMTNLFYAQFSGGLVDQDLDAALTVRLSSLTLPTATHPTNTISYLTTDLDVPKSDISIDKTLTFEFRLDDNYALYDFLLKQQANTSIPNLGYAMTSVPDAVDGGLAENNNTLDVTIYTPQALSDYNQAPKDSSGAPDGYRPAYKYKHCWVSNVKLGSYSYSNSDPITVTATLYFYDYEDLQEGIKA